jgi:hypothetical protein
MKVKKTSRDAHNSIKEAKSFYHQKIISGLELLKVGGNYEEISRAAGIKPDQAWKRISELVAAGRVFDTGITRKLSSNRKGTVWQLKDLPVSEEVPVISSPTKTKKAQQHLNQQPLLSL